MKSLIFALLVVGVFVGCAAFTPEPKTQDVVVQKVDKDDLREIIKNDKMLAGMEINPEAIFFSSRRGNSSYRYS